MAERSSGGIVLFALVVFGGMYLVRDANLGRQAPDFSLPDTYGGSVDLASYRGRPVLLVFWMTSCGICRHELPTLSQMAPQFRSKGIAVVAIHLGSADEARDYIGPNHIDLTSLVDADGTVARAYHVSAVPKLVLIGNDGIIRKTTTGMADESVLVQWMGAVSGS